MNFFKKGKKSILSILMMVLLIPTLVLSTGSVKVKAASIDPVKLYTSDTWSGKYSYSETTIAIKVANLGPNKKVYAHALTSTSNNWNDYEAEYVTTLSDGSEIWEVYIGDFGGGLKEFALKYEVNGQTYWDNNNGQNYTKESAGIAPVKAIRSIPCGVPSKTINIAARVQNYAYNKKVTVRYTTDNWATFNDVALSYSSSYSDGTELWEGSITFPYIFMYNNQGFEYAIKYEVNGQTYWDNNFNRNYDSNYEVSHY